MGILGATFTVKPAATKITFHDSAAWELTYRQSSCFSSFCYLTGYYP
jgi:hypothetical protein